MKKRFIVTLEITDEDRQRIAAQKPLLIEEVTDAIIAECFQEDLREMFDENISVEPDLTKVTP